MLSLSSPRVRWLPPEERLKTYGSFL
jgi:hypothetical protein